MSARSAKSRISAGAEIDGADATDEALEAELRVETDFSGWQAGWSRPYDGEIYEWGNTNVYLHAAYAQTGWFDVTSSRHLVEPFRAVKNPLIRVVSNIGALQSGKSLIADVSIPFFMVNDPGPIMWTFQSDPDGREHMKTRAMPLWRSIRALRPLLPQSRSDMTTMEIYFGHFFFLANGANPNSLQSKSIRYKFNSEIWLPSWQELYEQAVGRVSAFEKVATSKVVNDSHAGSKGDVADRVFLAGTREYWSIPCPACGVVYPLRMTQKRPDGTRFGLTWSPDALRADGTISEARAAETVHYVCACGHVWPHDPRTYRTWNDTGLYVASNPEPPADNRSFCWSGLVSTTLPVLAQKKAAALNALRSGFDDLMRDFKRQREVEPWEERTATITIEQRTHGYARADYANGQPIADEVDRAMTIDPGQDHYWCEVVAWRADGSTRHLHAGRYETDDQLREVQQRYHVADRKTFEDSGHNQDRTFEHCIRYGWIALRGSPATRRFRHTFRDPNNEERIEYRFYSTLQRGQGGAPYVYFSSNDCQDILQNLLTAQSGYLPGTGQPIPPALMEFPDDVIPEVFDHFKGAHKVEKRAGQWTWEKVHSRSPDHLRDCRVMQIVFGLIKGYLKHEPKQQESDK